MATKFSKSATIQFNRGLYKKGGSTKKYKEGGSTPRSKDEYRKPGVKNQPLSEYSGAPWYKNYGNLVIGGANKNPYTGEKLKGAPTLLNKAGTFAKKSTSKKMGGSTKKYKDGGPNTKSMAPAPAVKKPVVKKAVEKSTNIYSKNPSTGKEEQMVMRAGKYAFPSRKKGGMIKSKKK